MKRTPLSQRSLPRYSRGEEIMNMVTHIVGGVMGLLVLLLCPWQVETSPALTGVLIYGICMTALYVMSSVYHGLRSGTAKKVMQVLDHCSIYFLIAGTYTPILLSAFLPRYPGICWGLLAMEWGLTVLAVTLTAIDLKKYNVFSMACYLFMGWGIIFFLPKALEVLTKPGFFLLLLGGIVYTLGAVLYGVGVHRRWMHAVFHIFVVMGSLLQFVAIYFYAL